MVGLCLNLDDLNGHIDTGPGVLTVMQTYTILVEYFGYEGRRSANFLVNVEAVRSGHHNLEFLALLLILTS